MGLCSLLLSLLSDPSGSSDSLHSGSPSDTPRLLSLLLVCQCLSPSSPGLSPSLSCLVSFHRSKPRSRRVEGFALPAQTAATLGRPCTNLSAPVLPPPPPPHGPASLRRRRLLRVEGDPDLHSFYGQIKKTHKKPHTTKVEEPFRFALRSEEREGGQRGETGKRKKEIPHTKPSVKRWLVTYEEEREVSAAVP